MRSKDTCPSCGEKVTPGDLLCWNCELILDPSQIPDRPSGDLSVVRRMLEVPQRGVPSARPQRQASATGAPGGRNDGPTKVFALGREHGVPLVVASLSKKAARLSELEAFVVSFIDGESDVPALAERAGLGVLELGVVLQALNDKMIVDFADEPGPDAEPPPALVEAASQQTLLGDESEVDANAAEGRVTVERRPALRPQETPEEALARQQPTPPPPGERTLVGEPPRARPPPTERVSAADLAAASRRSALSSTSGEQTPVEGALQPPHGLPTALTMEFDRAPAEPLTPVPDAFQSPLGRTTGHPTPAEALRPVADPVQPPSGRTTGHPTPAEALRPVADPVQPAFGRTTGNPTPVEALRPVADAHQPTSSTDRELREVPGAPVPRAPPTVLLSAEDIANAQATAAPPTGLALSEEAFAAALAAPTVQVAAEVQPLEDTDERPAHRLHEADAVEPPRTGPGESIIFASSWPTVHPSFFAEPAPEPKPSGVKSASFVVSPTPRSLEPVADQPSIIVAPMTGEHSLPPPPPPPHEAPAPAPEAPPAIAPVTSEVGARRRRSPGGNRQAPPAQGAAAPADERGERRPSGRLRAEPSKSPLGRSAAETNRLDTPTEGPEVAAGSGEAPAARPSETPHESADPSMPATRPSTTPHEFADPLNPAVRPSMTPRESPDLLKQAARPSVMSRESADSSKLATRLSTTPHESADPSKPAVRPSATPRESSDLSLPPPRPSVTTPESADPLLPSPRPSVTPHESVDPVVPSPRPSVTPHESADPLVPSPRPSVTPHESADPLVPSPRPSVTPHESDDPLMPSPRPSWAPDEPGVPVRSPSTGPGAGVSALERGALVRPGGTATAVEPVAPSLPGHPSPVPQAARVPSPASTPPEPPSGPVPVAPASRPRRTLPGAGRVTASRPAPPIVLDAPGSRPPSPATVIDGLGPSGTVPEGVLSPVPPRPAPLVVAPMPVASPPVAAAPPPVGPRQPMRPTFPDGARVPPGRTETRPEVSANLPVPLPTAPLEGAAPSLADEPPPSTDPRIINRGNMNKRVLDALKQVKRREGPSEPAAPREEPVETVADRLAAGPLQVALRMEQNGRLEEAIRYLEKSIAQSPDAPSLYNRLAIILMRERADLRRAEQLLQKAVELAPENTVYDTNLKAVLAKRAMTKK
jgi:hypothetical protein